MKRTARIIDLSNPRVREDRISEIKERRGFWWWTCEKFHPSVTRKQRGYWFAVVVVYLADFLTEGMGEIWTEDQAHDFAKAFWLPPAVRVMPDGTEYRSPMSTKDLTTKEFAQLVDSCVLWLGEQGTYVPKPNEFEDKESEQT